MLAAGAALRDEGVAVWETATGAPILVERVQMGIGAAVAWLSDGLSFVAAIWGSPDIFVGP